MCQGKDKKGFSCCYPATYKRVIITQINRLDEGKITEVYCCEEHKEQQFTTNTVANYLEDISLSHQFQYSNYDENILFLRRLLKEIIVFKSSFGQTRYASPSYIKGMGIMCKLYDIYTKKEGKWIYISVPLIKGYLI